MLAYNSHLNIFHTFEEWRMFNHMVFRLSYLESLVRQIMTRVKCPGLLYSNVSYFGMDG